MQRDDTPTTIFIDAEMPAEELAARIAAQPVLDFIHVDHVKDGGRSTSLIMLSRHDRRYRPLLMCLALHGFHLFSNREGLSRFVRQRRIGTFWHEVLQGDVSVDESDIAYTFAPPRQEAGPPSLLVVYSSIHEHIYTPSLRRHFYVNFPKLRKYVPPNTAILRIADMGGVVGSYYMDTYALPDNEANVWALIARIAKVRGIATDDIVHYGLSKGGSAALLYAARHGGRAVLVDPILSDRHYLENYDDFHFTEGLYPVSKEEKFGPLLARPHPALSASVIFSSRSPQAPTIRRTLLEPFAERFTFLDVDNPAIRDHVDVHPNAMAHIVAQLSCRLAGVEMGPGLRRVF